MSNPLPDFDILFKDDNYWQSSDGKTFRVSALRNVYECSADALNTLHPFLAECVFERIKYNGRVDSLHFALSQDVVLTLAYLKTGGLSFNDEGGNTIELAEVDSLDQANFSSAKVIIKGPGMKIEYTQQPGRKYPIVRDRGWSNNIVNKRDLDTRYPGWEERWNIAKDIGFDDDLIGHVFKPATPQVKQSLEGVDFNTNISHE